MRASLATGLLSMTFSKYLKTNHYRKYNRGSTHNRRNVWILGGVCRETGDMFLAECPNRNKPTLEALIIANVEDGTTIYTDGWSSYRKVHIYFSPFILQAFSFLLI